jgi:uncharacterized protein YbjT (DUF2867 family)
MNKRTLGAQGLEVSAIGFGCMGLRDSAVVIEASDLDYTILRPGWFTHDDEVSYQVTQKGEPFRGHGVSLNSRSDLVVKLVLTPGMEIRRSLGVSRG